MSDYRRTFLPGGTFFFTVVTHNRKSIFTSEKEVEILRTAFRKVKAKRPFHIDAMVILPDHLHCVWQLPQGDSDYSSRWREIKKASSRNIDIRTNRRNERPVWQRRFWEHAIRDEADWHRHKDYIHYNPVKHGLTERPADWQWSSLGQMVANGLYESNWGVSQPSNIEGMDLE